MIELTNHFFCLWPLEDDDFSLYDALDDRNDLDGGQKKPSAGGGGGKAQLLRATTALLSLPPAPAPDLAESPKTVFLAVIHLSIAREKS